MNSSNLFRRAAPWLGAALLSACAQLDPQGGMTPLRATADPALGLPLPADKLALQRTDDDRRAVDAAVAPLLARPLTQDAAVQIALLQQPALQARFAALGVADAERVQMTRLDNPGFSFKRTRADDVVGIERTLGFNLLQLVNLPARRRLGDGAFEQARIETLDALLATASETRRAWVEAVAAAEALHYARRIALAAEAGGELASAMRQAGNWSALDAAREQAFHAEAQAQVTRAELAAQTQRERLIRLLGLARGTALQLPERLPELPAVRQAHRERTNDSTVRPEPVEGQLDIDALERHAIAQRLDLAAGRQQLALRAESLGLTRRTRLINVLELAAVNNTATGASAARGYEIGFEIPLFDWGEARVAAAEGLYLQQAHSLAQQVVDTRSEVRLRHATLQRSEALARRYRNTVIPLRERIARETLLRYNGMLIGVFELLADAREQIAAVQGANEALRDYWLAMADLQQALGGALPAADRNAPEPAIPPAPAPARGHEEHRHD